MTQAESKAELRLRITRKFDAPREEVCRAWTDPEALQPWWFVGDGYAPGVAEIDLRAGGKYRLGMKSLEKNVDHVVGGVFREVRVPEKLVYTWTWEDAESPHQMLITVEFLARGAATEVVLVHENLPDTQSRTDHETGWNGVIAQLERFFASK
ncbi:MAG: SRPBCC domain-containing protein [Candidatus Krumholzibacteriia bacterium]